jgi:CheY-like chemotaxis protein
MSRILVADDDLVQLELRRMMLEAAGHVVFLAANAPQALRSLREHTPDMVMIDLRLPNAQGVPDSREGLSLIRSVKELCGTAPVVVLSGWPEDLDGQPEEKMVDRVLQKPFRPSALMDLVRELVP